MKHSLAFWWLLFLATQFHVCIGIDANVDELHPLCEQATENFITELHMGLQRNEIDVTRPKPVSIPGVGVFQPSQFAEEAREWLLLNQRCEYGANSASVLQNGFFSAIPFNCMSFYRPRLSGYRFLIVPEFVSILGLGNALGMLNLGVDLALKLNLTFVAQDHTGKFKDIGPQDGSRGSNSELNFGAKMFKFRWLSEIQKMPPLNGTNVTIPALYINPKENVRVVQETSGPLLVFLNYTHSAMGLMNENFLFSRSILLWRNYFTGHSIPERVQALGDITWTRSNVVRIVMHIRRGDVSDPMLGRYQDEKFFSDAITAVFRGLRASGEHRLLVVRVYSQEGFNATRFEECIGPELFAPDAFLTLVYRINANVPEFFEFVASADVFVSSYSSFSFVAAHFVPSTAITIASEYGRPFSGVPNACSLIFLHGNLHPASTLPGSRACWRGNQGLRVIHLSLNTTWLSLEVWRLWRKHQSTGVIRRLSSLCTYACERPDWVAMCSKFPEHYQCSQLPVLDAISSDFLQKTDHPVTITPFENSNDILFSTSTIHLTILVLVVGTAPAALAEIHNGLDELAFATVRVVECLLNHPQLVDRLALALLNGDDADFLSKAIGTISEQVQSLGQQESSRVIIAASRHFAFFNDSLCAKLSALLNIAGKASRMWSVKVVIFHEELSASLLSTWREKNSRVEAPIKFTEFATSLLSEHALENILPKPGQFGFLPRLVKNYQGTFGNEAVHAISYEGVHKRGLSALEFILCEWLQFSCNFSLEPVAAVRNRSLDIVAASIECKAAGNVESQCPNFHDNMQCTSLDWIRNIGFAEYREMANLLRSSPPLLFAKDLSEWPAAAKICRFSSIN